MVSNSHLWKKGVACWQQAEWSLHTVYAILWPLINVVEWWCWYNSIASWLNATDTSFPCESIFQSSLWAAIAQLFLSQYWQQNASSGWYQAFGCPCCLGTHNRSWFSTNLRYPPSSSLTYTHQGVLVAMATVEQWLLEELVGGDVIMPVNIKNH